MFIIKKIWDLALWSQKTIKNLVALMRGELVGNQARLHIITKETDEMDIL